MQCYWTEFLFSSIYLDLAFRLHEGEYECELVLQIWHVKCYGRVKVLSSVFVCVCVCVWATNYEKLELSLLIIHLLKSDTSLSLGVFFFLGELKFPCPYSMRMYLCSCSNIWHTFFLMDSLMEVARVGNSTMLPKWVNDHWNFCHGMPG
jgi:hypothetical protein